MHNIKEVAVPEPPEEIQGVKDKFLVVYPLKLSGTYIKPGDILFSVDIGPAVLEVESKYEGEFTTQELIAGNIVAPNQIVGSIDLAAAEPKPPRISFPNFISFVLGVVVTTCVFLALPYV